MFLPFMINTEYEHRPLFTWIFGGLILLLNLFFVGMELVGFDWLIEAKYSEVVRVMDFNENALHFYNYVTYALFFPNIWVFLIDILGFVFFGMAVEGRLGWWRTALLFFVCVVTAAVGQQFLAPEYRFAGMTAGVFGLLAAAILLFSYSDTDGLALAPIPPDWDMGITQTYTFIFFIVWAAIPLTYTFLTRHDRLSIIGPIGMGVALGIGLLLAAALMDFKIPLFWPRKYDPAVQARMAAEERRRKLEEDLEKDRAERGEKSTEPGGVQMSPTGSLQLPDNPDIAGAFSNSDSEGEPDEEDEPRAQGMEDRKNALSKLALMNASTELAEAYESFFRDFPDECLKPGDMLDVGRQLENSYYRELAFDAYERLIQCHPNGPAAGQALLRAGKVTVHLEGKEEKGLSMLENYLETEPGRAQVLEARQAMEELKKRLEEKGKDPGQVETPSDTPEVPTDESSAVDRPDESSGQESDEEQEMSGSSSFQKPDKDVDLDLGALPSYESSSAPEGDGPLKIDGLEGKESSKDFGASEQSEIALPDEESPPSPPQNEDSIELPGEPEEPSQSSESHAKKADKKEFNLPRVKKSEDEEIVIQPRENSDMEIKIEVSERKSPSTDEPTVISKQSEEREESPEDTGISLRSTKMGAEDTRPPEVSISDAESFAVILEPENPVKLRALSLSLSEALSEPRESVRDRLIRRKGLIEQDLNLEEAKLVRRACEEAGCPARIVAQTPQLKFGSPRDAEMVKLENGSLVWTLSIGEKKVESRKALMLSAGAVRLDEEGERVRMVLSAYFADPPEAFHLWESTLRPETDSRLEGVFPEEALTILAERLANACSQARRTHGFELAFGDVDEEPLMFNSELEFRSYDIWNLLAAFAPSPESD